MDDLRAAVCLDDMRHLAGRCHELKGERRGHLALELHEGWRLVFKPAEDPPPLKEDGGLDWRQVLAIHVVDIVDYH